MPLRGRMDKWTPDTEIEYLSGEQPPRRRIAAVSGFGRAELPAIPASVCFPYSESGRTACTR